MPEWFWISHAYVSLAVYFLAFIGLGILPLLGIWFGRQNRVLPAFKSAAVLFLLCGGLGLLTLTFQDTPFTREHLGTELHEGLAIGTGIVGISFVPSVLAAAAFFWLSRWYFGRKAKKNEEGNQ